MRHVPGKSAPVEAAEAGSGEVLAEAAAGRAEAGVRAAEEAAEAAATVEDAALTARAGAGANNSRRKPGDSAGAVDSSVRRGSAPRFRGALFFE